jgi:aminopeptidase N
VKNNAMMKCTLIVLGLMLFVSACGSSKNEADGEAFEIVMDGEGSGDEGIYEDDSLMDFEDWGPYEDYDGFDPPYNASRRKYMDLVHTKIEASFNWEESQMIGKATLTMKPHFYATDSVVLDAKGMEITAVWMNGNELQYEYPDGEKLTVHFGQNFKKDEKITVVVEYIAKPEEREAGGGAAITSDKGLFFINPTGDNEDVMPQIWTQGETEANSVWFPTLDAPNSKTSQEIILTVEDKYVTLSNGKLVSSKKDNKGMRTDHWKQDLPHAPYLFMMAVGEFKVVKDFYTRKDGKKMEVNYYVEPEYENDARAIFGKTPKMIKFFSEKLGVEYPWDKYSQIVVRDYVSGAMENSGAVVFGDFVYKTKKELIDGNDESTIAHELFHHWFGDLVTCESWANLPLNESFANYSQYLWDEYEYGIDEADYNAEEEANGYYSGQEYKNLIRFEYNDKEEMFDNHSYNKGGRILHMLRNYLGDEAFFAGLNRYLTVNAYKSVEIHDLRLAMEEVSGEDLNWFFNQWFLSKGHPVLFTEQVIDQENNTVTVKVNQAQNFGNFKIPVNLALWDADGKHVYPITIENETEEFSFPFVGKLENVHLDDDQMLLAKVYEEKPIEQLIHQYYNANRYRSKATALKRIAKSSHPNKLNIILEATNAPFWGIRASALDYLNKMDEINDKKSLKTAVLKILEKDKKSLVRKEAVALLSKIEKTDAIKTVRGVLLRDSSIAVLGAAISVLKEIDSVQALSIARELSSSKEAEIRVSAAEIMGEYGNAQDLPYIEELILGGEMKDYNKLRALLSYAYHVIRNGSTSMDRAIEVLTYSKKNGNQYTGWYFEMIVERFMEILQSEQEVIDEELQQLGKNSDINKIQSLKNKKASLEKVYNGLSLMMDSEDSGY